MATPQEEKDLAISQLFSELSKFSKNGEYAKGQKVANKILKELPDDKDALHCKVVCLVQQSCFQEALDVSNSAERKGIIQLPFERAYCLYRLNRLGECLKVLQPIEEKSLREKELLSQVLYRLEDYSKCLQLYRDLIKNSQDDLSDERETNMMAVIAAAKLWTNNDMGVELAPRDTFEFCYNNACFQLGKKNYAKAKEMLLKAEELCKKSLSEDADITEEEIEEELAIVRAQLAYVQQITGKMEDASQIYNKMLKHKPSEIALAAIVSNNLSCINQDQSVFDAKKKLKIMQVDGLANKLTKMQRKSLETNKCLLNIFVNQVEACRKNLAKLKTDFNDPIKAALIEAAMLLKDKHPDQAITSLQGVCKENPDGTELQLALAQLYLTKGKVNEACAVLESVKEYRHKPAMVSLLVDLYSPQNNIASAIKVLDGAVSHYEKAKTPEEKQILLTLVRQNASFKLKQGKKKEGVDMLEKLRKEDPSDVKTLAQIITAYASIDLKKAEQYSESLPPVSELLHEAEVDVDALEAPQAIVGYRLSKKPKIPAQTDAASSTPVVVKKKRKRKTKTKLPKNYNSEVDPDPERWLPRWERSTFKHKKTKRSQVGKGTQGSASMNEGPTSPKSSRSTPGGSAASPTPSGATSPQASANVIPPRQQRQGANKAKPKKKKKGGW